MRSTLAGRSPLTRGRRTRVARCMWAWRSIPAHAGETCGRGPACWPAGVDPRSRGGDFMPPTPCERITGRSPLTRGRRGAHERRLSFRGSIPAHAGETGWPATGNGQHGVDPRSRGGDQRRGCHSWRANGRSPLTRGRPGHTTDNWGAHRSIPAHAGETCPADGVQARREVDPRSRGGDLQQGIAGAGHPGRSPLTRGRPSCSAVQQHRHGSIPAHAGETHDDRWRTAGAAVDPRSRGGDCSSL